MKSAHISKDGVSDVMGIMAPKTKDKSGASPVSVRSGANIKKVSSGMNGQIVPPVTRD